MGTLECHDLPATFDDSPSICDDSHIHPEQQPMTGSIRGSLGRALGSAALAGMLTSCAASGTGPRAAQSSATCPSPSARTRDLESPLSHVRYLADDALEGRESGTAGERCAAGYLASMLEQSGLEGSGEGGSFFQSFTVRGGSQLGTHNLLRVMDDVVEVGLGWSPYGYSATGHATGTAVYGAHGISRPGEDDGGYGDLELDGHVVVVESGDPRSPTGASLESEAHFKATEAAIRGAVALIVLLPAGSDLPELATETRPATPIPVAAVRGTAADALRSVARSRQSVEIMAEIQPLAVEARNVIAHVPGSDPDLRDEIVVVGAHYDHLGFGGDGSLAAGSRAIHNGADDNASGTAALLEIADRLAHAPVGPARTVIFAAFTGEERGLLGSQAFVANPPFPTDATVAMVNMDMVGRLEDDRLTVFGVGTAEEWPGLLREVNASLERPFDIGENPDGYGPSDHSSFYGEGIPVLHFFTNTHVDYHRPSDDWTLINADGLERVAEMVTLVVARLAGAEGTAMALNPIAGAGNPMTGGASSEDPQSSSASSGYGPYLGTIPDMSGADPGVRLTGVREASPAADAGLQRGDVIVAFGGREVGDLYEYTYALRAHAPGDRVEIVVLRDGERVTLSAVLGRRR